MTRSRSSSSDERVLRKDLHERRRSEKNRNSENNPSSDKRRGSPEEPKRRSGSSVIEWTPDKETDMERELRQDLHERRKSEKHRRSLLRDVNSDDAGETSSARREGNDESVDPMALLEAELLCSDQTPSLSRRSHGPQERSDDSGPAMEESDSGRTPCVVTGGVNSQSVNEGFFREEKVKEVIELPPLRDRTKREGSPKRQDSSEEEKENGHRVGASPRGSREETSKRPRRSTGQHGGGRRSRKSVGEGKGRKGREGAEGKEYYDPVQRLHLREEALLQKASAAFTQEHSKCGE